MHSLTHTKLCNANMNPYLENTPWKDPSNFKNLLKLDFPAALFVSVEVTEIQKSLKRGALLHSKYIIKYLIQLRHIGQKSSNVQVNLSIFLIVAHKNQFMDQ